MPELFPTPRALDDDPSTKNRLMVPGSASPELRRQLTESLTSRIALVDVSGFPKAFPASSDSFARRWHLDFFRTFLERDIPQLGLSIPLDRNLDVLSLDDVLNMLASYFQGFLALGFQWVPLLAH